MSAVWLVRLPVLLYYREAPISERGHNHFKAQHGKENQFLLMLAYKLCFEIVVLCFEIVL